VQSHQKHHGGLPGHPSAIHGRPSSDSGSHVIDRVVRLDAALMTPDHARRGPRHDGPAGAGRTLPRRHATRRAGHHVRPDLEDE